MRRMQRSQRARVGDGNETHQETRKHKRCELELELIMLTLQNSQCLDRKIKYISAKKKIDARACQCTKVRKNK